MNKIVTRAATAEPAAVAAQAPAAAAPRAASAPERIEPRLDADGKPVDQDPPSGGSWLREADGGLRPADAFTARGAGLAWPG